MIRVKVCGLTHPDQARAAAEAGADFVGVVFAPSRRRVTLEVAQEVARALNLGHNMGVGRPALVGVFADAPLDQVVAAARACPLDWVQLNGDETVEYCLSLDSPLIKALRLPAEIEAAAALARLLPYHEALAPRHGRLLVEAAVPGHYGGSGQPLDWTLAGHLARQVPFLLAGGLTPENVAEAIARVRPWGVDVSSGVETNGVKDLAKVRAFVKNARGRGRNE
ncbi:MAG: phosphoribosylanthranilate isomerase [Chloroflexi bacterium]|nr:phosphoribosylanthranilate isomerase [Chloroflexota bacterium]